MESEEILDFSNDYHNYLYMDQCHIFKEQVIYSDYILQKENIKSESLNENQNKVEPTFKIEDSLNNDNCNVQLNYDYSESKSTIDFNYPGSTYLRILEYFQNEKELFKDKFTFEDVEKFIIEYFDIKSLFKITFKPNKNSNNNDYISYIKPSLDIDDNAEDLKLGK